MKETPLLHSIRAFLASQPGVTIWRCNTGVDTTRGVRYGLGIGAADLIGIVHQTGRFLAMEVKTPIGRLSAEQKLWGAAVQRAGGFYAVVRSIEQAAAALTEARKS